MYNAPLIETGRYGTVLVYVEPFFALFAIGCGVPQATLNPEILVPRVLWRFENRQKSENTENTENTLHSFILTLNNISTFFLTYNV